MLIGFKIIELTDSARPLAYDFVRSVCFLREEDLEDIIDKWKHVTIYSTEITEAILDALPFPVSKVFSGSENTVINNVESILELPYVDENNMFQMFKLGITESKNISDFIRYQLTFLEYRNIIRYLDRIGDYDQRDYDKDDYLTDYIPE